MIFWGAAERLYWLWLLLPLAVLIFYGLRRQLRALASLLAADIVPVLASGFNPQRRRWQYVFWLVGVGLCLLALARPQWGFHWEEVRQHGLDIMVVLDTSRSMLAEDVKPNRLQQAKWGIRDLVKNLHGDRVGLVAFAGGNFLQCPLTSDYAAFLLTLDDVYVGIIPTGGTAIAPALRKAMDSFEESKSGADKVIILVTDGEDHEGKTAKLIPELKDKGIRVYAIGIGTLGGDLLPLPGDGGSKGFVKDRAGKVVKSSLREDALQELAVATGGIYVRSAPGDSGLDKVFSASWSQLKRTDNESRVVKTHEERFYWLLLVGFGFFVLEAVFSLGGMRGQRPWLPARPLTTVVSDAVPNGRAERIPPKKSRKAFLVALLFLFPDRSYGDQWLDGLDSYAQSNYAQASESFAAAAAEKDRLPENVARAHFYEGNALFRLQKYGEAAAVYDLALRAPDLSLQNSSYFNKANALVAFAQGLEAERDLDGALKSLEAALQSYRNALLLDAKDAAARNNYELALRYKENLEKKKQEEEQQEKEKDQGDQKNEQKKQEQSNEQQNQQEPEQGQNEGQQEKPESKEQSGSSNTGRAEEMTEEEALLLLDAMKAEEKAQREKLRLIMGRPEAVEKDW